MSGSERYYDKSVLFLGGVADGQRRMVPGNRERWQVSDEPEKWGPFIAPMADEVVVSVSINITNYIIDELLINRGSGAVQVDYGKEPYEFFFAYPEGENGAFKALSLLFNNYKPKVKDNGEAE